MSVSRETMDRLQILAELVQKWSPTINLVSKTSLADLWSRHVLDSLQLYDLAPSCRHWADLGSGGGFPGLVIAAAAAEKSLPRQVTLVESDQRKAVFLRNALREMECEASVLNRRIEATEGLQADVISARALAPLSALLGHTAAHLKSGGTALFPKGATWQDEVAVAREAWSFDAVAHPSKTQANAVILEITKVKHV